MLEHLLSLPTTLSIPSTGTATSASSADPSAPTLLLFHFIHTTSGKQLVDNKRFIRCLESVFYHHHPNGNATSIIMHVPQDEDTIGLHTEFTDEQRHALLGPFLDAGYNITIQPFQLKSLMDQAMNVNGSAIGDTNPCSINHQRAENWYNTQRIKHFMTKNWYVDVSDLVRLLVLYMYGGTYLDTDVIVVKPLNSLPHNTIGYERQYEYDYDENKSQRQKQQAKLMLNGEVNNAVLVNFQIGNEFICDCINEYFLTYKSSTYVWGYVGPRLFQRVLGRSKYRTKLGSGNDCEILSPPSSLPSPSSSSSTSLQSTAVDSDNHSDKSMIPLPTSLLTFDSYYCPAVILWKDAFYIDIASNECLIPTTVEVCL